MDESDKEDLLARIRRLNAEYEADPNRKDRKILQAIKDRLPDLEKASGFFRSHWGYEDPIYRFYHHSFKVYWLTQGKVTETVSLFREIGRAAGVIDDTHGLNPYYLQIVNEGTGKSWQHEHNERWLQETRPMVEAFLHTEHLLRMMVKYGSSLEDAPTSLPSGWATVLYLYNCR